MITHLSFTRLKELEHSPLALKRYIEGTKVSTDAMTEGSLLDCLLFEPETFEDRFYQIPQIDRRTKEGKAIWEIALVEAEKKTIVRQDQVFSAKQLVLCIESSPTVVYNGLMVRENFIFQKKVEFFYYGFKHKGVKDAEGIDKDGRRVVWDLKRMGSKSGEKDVRYNIRNMRYDLQAAIYCHEYDEKGEEVYYYIIAVDNDGYITPFEISLEARMRAKQDWNRLVMAAHRCNMEEHQLDIGPEFWTGNRMFFEY